MSASRASRKAVGVVLLAAGYGTRLYPLTKERPKALLALGSGALMDPILDGVREIPRLSRTVLVSNHRFAKAFEDWTTNRRLPIEIVDDGTSTPDTRCGAIRDLAMGLQRLDPADDVLVLGTDNLFSWSLKDFVASAQAVAPSPSVAVYQVQSEAEARRFGVVVADSDGRIRQFLEKPAHPPSLTIALCVYYFPASTRPRVQEFIQQGGNVDAPGFLLEWLIAREPTYAVMTGGIWFDIGTSESYQDAIVQWTNRVG